MNQAEHSSREPIRKTHDARGLIAADQGHQSASRRADLIKPVEQSKQALARLQGKPFTRGIHHPHLPATGCWRRSQRSSEESDMNENSNPPKR